MVKDKTKTGTEKTRYPTSKEKKNLFMSHSQWHSDVIPGSILKNNSGQKKNNNSGRLSRTILDARDQYWFSHVQGTNTLPNVLSLEPSFRNIKHELLAVKEEKYSKASSNYSSIPGGVQTIGIKGHKEHWTHEKGEHRLYKVL